MEITYRRDERTGQERPQEKDFNRDRRVVRVVPKNADMRKYLKHGLTRVGFLAEGSSEWPNDQFTRRRIRDGDVTVEERKAIADASAPDETNVQAEGEQTIEPSGAKSGRRQRTAEPASETSSQVDPDRTTAPKTSPR